MKKKYYIAYGSNMDIEQMALRCPDAILIGKSELQGYELLFKGSLTGAYATIEANEDSIVPVLIWEISKADEANLDRYEGYPTFYYKKELEVVVEGNKLLAMVYIMDEKRQLGHPSNRYYRILKLAYERFGFDLRILKSALKKSILKGGQSIEFWS